MTDPKDDLKGAGKNAWKLLGPAQIAAFAGLVYVVVSVVVVPEFRQGYLGLGHLVAALALFAVHLTPAIKHHIEYRKKGKNRQS